MASRSDDGEGRAQHNAVSKHREYQPLSVTLRVTAPPKGSLYLLLLLINLNNSQLTYKRINIREVITKNGKIIWY